MARGAVYLIRFREPPLLGALNHPRLEIGRGRWNGTFRAAFHSQRLGGADHRAQSAAHTSARINDTEEFRLRDNHRPKLAALQAVATADARVIIHDCNKV